jgi:hypothetical protein
MKQKKRLHPKMEPYDRIEILIESSGKWTREEDTPFAGWLEVQGGGEDFKPGVADPDRGRRIRCGSHRH